MQLDDDLYAALEATSKFAYCIWEHRVGASVAWEHLTQAERSAWIEVVQYLSTKPGCICGRRAKRSRAKRGTPGGATASAGR